MKRKLTTRERIWIRALYRGLEGRISHAKLAGALGVSKSAIANAVNNETRMSAEGVRR